MAELLRLPEVAAGTTEAVLAAWLVAEGTPFAAGESIVEIETEKASVEVEAETDGVILKVLVQANTEVAVGSPIALIGAEADRGADVEALLADLGVTVDDPELLGRPAPPRRDVPEPEIEFPAPGQGPPAQDLTPAVVPPQNAAQAQDPQRLFVSPLARKMLKAAGIDPASVRGSGPRGRILRRDVEPAIALLTEPSTPAPGAHATMAAESKEPQGFKEVGHSRMRRAIAGRLTASKQTVPHFYLKRMARMDRLLDLRREINDLGGSRISVNDFVVKAVAVAHTRVPEANVTWTESAMRHHDSVDIAVAIDSDRGLVTPVVRGSQDASLTHISSAVRAFVDAANAGKLQQSDLEGGSITVTNLGMFGVDEFAAIINPPHSAILAVGAARQVALVDDTQVRPGSGMSLVLSVDHRAIDGALAAQWMQALVSALETPLSLLV
jgi:pyruvate dehydrogenase E2 component (dihydrolipoamide acetyltransferase)